MERLGVLKKRPAAGLCLKPLLLMKGRLDGEQNGQISSVKNKINADVLQDTSFLHLQIG